jgi:HSP20 family molecular chaperone IbpA
MMDSFLSAKFSSPLTGYPDDVKPTTQNLNPIDLRSTERYYEIWVNIPGFDKHCLEITLKDHVLSIAGKNPIIKRPTNLKISRREYSESFVYQIKLNTAIDPSKTESSVTSGVLYLKLVKSEPDAGVRIAI